LIDPVSVLSGEAPSERDSEHLFFRLDKLEEVLREWTGGDRLQREIRNKLKEWFDAGLRDWDISRDAPYWGFEIPGTTRKYFYVWVDAPIGYIASFKVWCDRHRCDFDEYWGRDSVTELYHFIGKDIAYFHTLFWPAMLHAAGFRTPTAVYCHGFLTVNGQKMSKRRGTFIQARTYLEHLNPEFLRYYYAAKLTSGVDDIDLNLEDFVLRVNSDLVGKYVNIASRCAGFIRKKFENRLSDRLPHPELFESFVHAGGEIMHAYEDREFSKAVRLVMSLADRANQYIDEQKPWVLVKDPSSEKQAHETCTQGLNLFMILSVYLKPILPETSRKAEVFLNIDSMTWLSARDPLLGHTIRRFEPLLRRVDVAQVEELLSDSRVD
jgi:methionyl-tRNA synthetase